MANIRRLPQRQHAARPVRSPRQPPSVPSRVPSEAQIKHLEFIQLVISRQAGNSFLAKGWVITVSGALYGFSVSHLNPWIAFVGLVPAAAFWWLDGYFLRAERLFRCLYDDARKFDTKVELFSMNVGPYRGDARNKWIAVMFSSTLLAFYGTLVAVGLVIFAASLVHNDKPVHAARIFVARSSSVSADQTSFAGQIFPMRSLCQRGTR
jgi:hypothetical protein